MELETTDSGTSTSPQTEGTPLKDIHVCIKDNSCCHGDKNGFHGNTSHCQDGCHSNRASYSEKSHGDDSKQGHESPECGEGDELLESDTDSHVPTIEDDTEEFEPPDGGFGWVVCACAFFLQLICDGLLFSFGVLYISLLEHFGEGKSRTSWVGAVFMGCSMLMGPLAGALAGKLGCRLTAILGSLIACVSLVISTFSPNIAILSITYGAMAGTGLSLMYLVSIVMVGSYFSKRRALANGIAMCGSGIGTFIMAPLLRYLLDEYSWNGTIMILAGIALNCCVFSSFFRPVTYKRVKRNPAIEIVGDVDGSVVTDRVSLEKVADDTVETTVDDVPKTDSGYASNGHMGKPLTPQVESSPQRTIVRRHSSLTDLAKYKKVQNNRLAAIKSEYQISHPQLSAMHATSVKSLSVHSRILRNIITTQSLVDTYWGKENVSTMSRREIFMSGSAWTIPRVHTNETRSERPSGSVYSRYSHNELPPTVRLSVAQTLRHWFFTCVRSFGIPLLRDPTLLMIVISCVFWTGQSTIYTYLVDYALYRGIDKHSSAFLLSIIGITNTVARIAIGWITDHPKIDSTIVYATALMIAGIISFVIPFCETFVTLAICSAIFGVCMATYVSLRSIIVVDLMGIGKLTGAFGLVISFQGISYTVVPPIAGAILEITGTYMGPFLSAGAFYALAAIVIAPVRICQRRCQKRDGKTEDIPLNASNE